MRHMKFLFSWDFYKPYTVTRIQQLVFILLWLRAGYYSPPFRFFFRCYRAPLKKISKREGKSGQREVLKFRSVLPMLLLILILTFTQISDWWVRKDEDNTGKRRVKGVQTERTVCSPEIKEHYSKSWTKPVHVNNCYLWGYWNPDPHYPSGRLNIASIGCETMKTFLWRSRQSCSPRTETHYTWAVRHRQTS